MRRPCPITIDCAGIGAPEPDWPVLNVSAEAPDPLIFYRINYPDYDPYGPVCLYNCEPLPDSNVTCEDIISSTESAEMADLLAQAAGIVCPVINPPTDEIPDPGPCEYINDEQTATVYCFDGSTSSFTVPAGAMASGPIACVLGDAWVAMANAWALAYAYQKASQMLECAVRSFPDVPTGPGGGTDPPAYPPGHVPGSPRIADNPGWCCVGEYLDPAYNTYTIVGGSIITEYVFSVGAGALPPGTSLVQLGPRTAEIMGIPTTPGQYNYTIRAVSTSIPTRVVEVADVFYVLGITNADTLPDAEVGVPYSETLTGAGGTAPYTFTTTDALPTGLTLASNGTISGTPSVDGDWDFNVSITDAEGGTCQQNVTIYVGAAECPDPAATVWVTSELDFPGFSIAEVTPAAPGGVGASFRNYIQSAFNINAESHAVGVITHNGPQCDFTISGTLLKTFPADFTTNAVLRVDIQIGGGPIFPYELIDNNPAPPPGVLPWVTGPFVVTFTIPDTGGLNATATIYSDMSWAGASPYEFEIIGTIANV